MYRKPLQQAWRPHGASLSTTTQGRPWVVRQELMSRTLPIAYDYLQPQPSHLLNLTLADLHPKLKPNSHDTSLPSTEHLRRLPVGHHLVYFPPQIPLSELLPDGTDVLHSPGKPYTRRLWAGGRVRFRKSGGPFLQGKRAACVETIRDVIGKGDWPKTQIMVKIERRIGIAHRSETEEGTRGRLFKEDEEDFGNSAIIENRDIVFLPTKSQEQLNEDKENFASGDRFIKPPQDPEFSLPITPTKALLFRFSALTFNAHSIHLDQSYTRNIEGYRNLLVHGPLTLALMLTALQNHLVKRMLVVQEIQYKNLLPLFVDEKMRICGKPQQGNGENWDVWIENKDGGLAVRGTVQTESMI